MATGKKEIVLLFKAATEKAQKNIKNVGDGLKQVGTKGKIAQKGLGFMSKGLKGIGIAIKAAGIGLFLGLLSQLTGLFSQNQKTTDAFQRILLKLKPLFDLIGKAVEAVVFVLEKLVDLFNNTIGALFGFSSASNDAASALVEQRNKVQLLTAELALLQLQYQKEAELMRQIRDDEARSIDERIQANFELGKVLAEQMEQEKALAMEGLRLAEMELALNEDNIDLQTKLIDAKTKLAEIDERITGQRSEQLTNLNALEREREAQQKEAAVKREEQLRKEAEALQNLIDLQNEDIKVKKKAFRTINEQFDNAEKANKEQLELLEKQKAQELANLEQSNNTAKQNIANKQEELKEFEETNKKLIKSNQDKADNFERVAQQELKRMGFTGVEYVKTQEDLITFQENVNKNLSAQLKYIEKETGMSIQEMADSWSPAIAFTANQTLGMIEDTQENVTKAINNIERLTKSTGEEIIAITDDQIQFTKDSLDKNLEITDSYEKNKAAIISKYDKQIQDTKESLGETEQQLQEQADAELFLHFETATEKEIRLAKEKYDKLLGLAQNNAELTKKLEEEKKAVLEEIETRSAREMINKQIELYKKLKEAADEKQKQDFLRMKKFLDEKRKEAKLEKELAKKSGMETLQMGIGLAKEGTAAYKALASTETIISTYAGATRAFKDVPSPFNFIQAGLIIAAGIKNLAEINKTKVEGAGGSSESITDTITDGGDMGGDVPALPTFGAIGTDAPPIQAFVVETDVSNAQALQSELNLQSTL
tara:strand:+ start:184 stop:2490 length:2307 start_codon:yes stop_codon:yes gene_type:complete